MNNSLAVFEFERQSVRFVDGFPVANDVASVLGYKDPAKTISTKVNQEYKGVGRVVTNGGIQNVIVLTPEGVKQLLISSKKHLATKKKLADFLGVTLNVLPQNTKEIELITIIQTVFSHIPSVTQFFISGYRIDLYFPDYRIAVECDEYGHSSYDTERELARQDTITKLLGCQFIRFNPHDVDFNIGNVINQIMQVIYH
jgi:very-short-patch-repair endonuclease